MPPPYILQGYMTPMPTMRTGALACIHRRHCPSLPDSRMHACMQATCDAKKGLLAAGMSDEITIEFFPQQYRYYYDCIRIHSEVGPLPGGRWPDDALVACAHLPAEYLTYLTAKLAVSMGHGMANASRGRRSWPVESHISAVGWKCP